MTQSEKDLLLQDLCARLPYGVKVRYSSYYEFITCTLQAINPVYNTIDLWSKDACFNPVFIDKIKPYLFPLSSMTEEQIYEINEILGGDFEIDKYGITDLIRNKRTSLSYLELDALFEYFNKNHLDYRGLIPMGLAIDATGKNIY